MTSMVIFGSSGTIFAKIMDQKVDTPTEESEFKHPLFMNLLMFSGEALLLPALYIKFWLYPGSKAAY